MPDGLGELGEEESGDETGGTAGSGGGGADDPAVGGSGTPGGSGGRGGSAHGSGGHPDDPARSDHPAHPGPRSAFATCARWNAELAHLDEGIWDGNLRRCDAGAISELGRDNALRRLNFFRWLAGLPAVTTTKERNELAQACALLQHANFRERGLSHEPPGSWDCYSDDGAQGSATSNIAGVPGVFAVDAYLHEIGNEADFGHRRIILSNSLGPVGLGSTGPGGASCMQSLPGDGKAGRPWLAWPPPGVFPLQAHEAAPFSLSTTGWSIQSEAIDLSSAHVEVRAEGRALDVSVHVLHGEYGGTSAIRIVPRGWMVRGNQRFTVDVTRVETPIHYEVEIVDCD